MRMHIAIAAVHGVLQSVCGLNLPQCMYHTGPIQDVPECTWTNCCCFHWVSGPKVTNLGDVLKDFRANTAFCPTGNLAGMS